jgi:hypothetical protein
VTHQKRMTEAIKLSGVKHVAIVDDVFDPPRLDATHFAAVLTLMESPQSDAARDGAGIKPADWADAKAKIGAGQYEEEVVAECVDALYAAHMVAFDPIFDPGGVFGILKADNLRNVKPIISFLRSCHPHLKVQTFGKDNVQAIPAAEGELVVFVDLYLSADISAEANTDTAEARQAIDDSIKRIAPLMNVNPSVVLMSSHAAESKVADYRRRLASEAAKGNVYASRFAFVEKTRIKHNPPNAFEFDQGALDDLLDLFQSYKFGRGLSEFFEAWTASAEKALADIRAEVRELNLKDLSYLVRFRLADEGQSLPDYLEWLLADSLIDVLSKHLDKHPRTAAFAHVSPQEAKKVGGAFEGPTTTVAKLYHRVRIEDVRTHPREHFRLGDLYLRKDKEGVEHVVAIMNPDCDLVSRSDGKRNAKTLITVQGHLEEFNAPKTSVGDFIMINGAPRNIGWDYKYVETLGLPGPLTTPGTTQGNEGTPPGKFEYIGALRPMYAQEIQANLLNQLGRVGVAVPPAIAFAAEVKIQYMTNKGISTLDIPFAGVMCYFVPERESGRGGRAVFTRQFVRGLLDAAQKVDPGALGWDETRKASLQALIRPGTEEKLLNTTYEGVVLEGLLFEGVKVTGRPDFKPPKEIWCWILLSVDKWDITTKAVSEVELLSSVAAVADETPREEQVAPGSASEVLAGVGQGASATATTGVEAANSEQTLPAAD